MTTATTYQPSAPPAEEKLTYARACEELSEMQRKFVEAYVMDPCATRAARAAGYSATSAKSKGTGLFQTPKIRRAIDLWREEHSDVLSADYVKYLRHLEILCYTNILPFVGIEFDECDKPVVSDELEPLWAAVQECKITRTRTRSGEDVTTVTVKLANKIDAARLLGQVAGFLDEAPIIDARPTVNVYGIDEARMFTLQQKRQEQPVAGHLPPPSPPPARPGHPGDG